MQRIQVLKYLVLTTMLMKSTINPFDSQETKPYKNDPRISVMTDLVDAYQRDDIHQYEHILTANPDLLSDPFIAENIDEVSRNMRTKAVLKLIAPYSRFTLAFIARQIKISLAEVQDILAVLIVEKRLNAKINQENGTVVVESSSDQEHLRRLLDWSRAIETLWTAVLNEGEGFRNDEGLHPGFASMSSAFGPGLSEGAFGNGLSMKQAVRAKPPVRGGRGAKIAIAGF